MKMEDEKHMEQVRAIAPFYDKIRLVDEVEDMTQEEIDKAHQAMLDELDRDREEERRVNSRLFAILRTVKGAKWMKGLEELLWHCEVCGAMSITRARPQDKHWQKAAFDPIKEMWVEQWSRGMDGDSFEGTIWVKIDNKRWLQLSFSC